MPDTPAKSRPDRGEAAEREQEKQQEVLRREPLEQELMQKGDSDAGTEIDGVEPEE